jgi:hypothetical protein
MSKIVWAFKDEYAGKIIIKRWFRCMREKGDKPIPIKIGKHFKKIKITKKKKEKGPENIAIDIENADGNGDFQVKVNCSKIQSPSPYNFKPKGPNWKSIKIEIAYQQQSTGNEGITNDPDTTVTIGDAPPGNPPGNKKKKK